jgi:hypothetical protein
MFLGAFDYIAESSIIFVMSVLQSVGVYQCGSYWTDFGDFFIGELYGNLSRNFSFCFDRSTVSENLYENVGTVQVVDGSTK